MLPCYHIYHLERASEHTLAQAPAAQSIPRRTCRVRHETHRHERSSHCTWRSLVYLRWECLYPKLGSHVDQRPVQLVLIIDGHQVGAVQRMPRRPRQHVPRNGRTLAWLEPDSTGKGAERAHGQARLRGLEPLERHLAHKGGR
eukprot:scaffold23320_cov129-Isochrysis_galbana.AAC.3